LSLYPWVALRDSGRELGTSYEIELVIRESEHAPAVRALAAAREQCHQLDATLSEWREDSDLTRLNQRAWHEPVPVAEPLNRLLAGALHVAKATRGTFDFTWAPLGVLWDQAESRGQAPDEAELAEARRHLGFKKVVLQGGTVRFLSPGTRLGVASFAKGWIIDALFQGLRGAGFPNVIVNIGGDLRTAGHNVQGGHPVFKVLDPYEPTRVAAAIAVVEGSLATSGNYFRRRRIGAQAFGHLFDPATGRPPSFDGSVTVLAADATMADALSTALFVMGPERGLEFARGVPGLEVLYLTSKGPLATAGLRAKTQFG
jgi:thiamine biosynthesis lipoprotein